MLAVHSNLKGRFIFDKNCEKSLKTNGKKTGIKFYGKIIGIVASFLGLAFRFGNKGDPERPWLNKRSAIKLINHHFAEFNLKRKLSNQTSRSVINQVFAGYLKNHQKLADVRLADKNLVMSANLALGSNWDLLSTISSEAIKSARGFGGSRPPAILTASLIEPFTAQLLRILEIRTTENERIKTNSLAMLHTMQVMHQKDEIAEFFAKEPQKKAALMFLRDKSKQLKSMSAQNPSYGHFSADLQKVKQVVKKSDAAGFTNLVKDYRDVYLPALKGSRADRIKNVKEAINEYSDAALEGKALHDIALDHLVAISVKCIIEMRSPTLTDFQSSASSHLESQLCLEAFKCMLLDPQFTHIDSEGVEWKGGTIQKLTGGSGGVYALGLQSQEPSARFKKLLVAKVVNEEPGAINGDQNLHKPRDWQALKSGKENPFIKLEDIGADPIRSGIAPGKGVVNEFLASMTPFNATPAVMTKIQHQCLKNPNAPQSCCVISFIESAGDLFSITAADATLARLKLDGIEDEDKHENLLKAIEKAKSMGIEQGTHLRQLEEDERLKLSGFEDQMLLNILMRNQDVKAQNLLLIPIDEKQFELKGIDNGATYSSIFQTYDELPDWCELKASKTPISSNPDICEKIHRLKADDLLFQMHKAYAKESLTMESGAELACRASVALIKSSICRLDLTYCNLAEITFKQTHGHYINGLAKASHLCSHRVNVEIEKGVIKENMRNAKLDEYLLYFFENRGEKLSMNELMQLGFIV